MTVELLGRVYGHHQHEPSRSRVAQRVWRDFTVEAGLRHSALESGLDRFDRLTIPLNDMTPNDAFLDPSSSQQLMSNFGTKK